MKVLNISRLKLNDKHNYYGGAIGNIAYNLLCSLAELNGIEVLTFTEGVDLKGEPPLSLKFSEVKSFADVRQNVNKILKNGDISLVTHFYFHEPEYNPVAKLVKKKGLPFVIGMCELPHPLLKDELTGVLKIPLAKAFGKSLVSHRFKKTLKLCDVLIVANEGAKEYYSRFIEGEKIRVVPYGVDTERFSYSPLPKDHKILIVSRLIKRRGIDYLVEAMPKIIKEFSDAELHLVGEGPRKEILRRRAEEIGISLRVFFHGNVSPEKLIELYRGCYVFCHLSFADGWNQPALEAMATGRAVICTDAPHNSMVEDANTGFLIPWGDSDILAEKIIYLFENYKVAEKMGREGRRKVENEHSWGEIAKEYYNVFQEVVE